MALLLKALLRSPQRPNQGWVRSFLAVLAGLIGPAIPALFIVWGSSVALSDAVTLEGGTISNVFLVASALMIAPLFVVAAPLTAGALMIAMAAVVHVARLTGWAGPLSLILLSVAIGLPFAHVFFNGDLTTEAPKMIPSLATAFATQAICGWLVLREWRVIEKEADAKQTGNR